MASEPQNNQALIEFLDSKTRDKFIEDWLVDDQGFPRWKAKATVKLIVAPLCALAGNVAGRGVKKIHGWLSKTFDDYDEVSKRMAELLLIKLECGRTKEDYKKKWLTPPPDEDPEKWKQLNEQTQVWIKSLEKLDMIAISLGELKANVRLTLDEPNIKKDSPPSRWLKPYNEFIPFVGRGREMKQLSDWCEKDAAFGWKIIIGEGGMGKTRLAREFAKNRREAVWDAGFMDITSLENLVRHDQFPQWSPVLDTLIIVDYAAAKQEYLKTLLHRVGECAREDEPAKLRLLLLERHAKRDEGWVKEIMSETEGALKDEIEDALEVEIPELQPPYQTEDPIDMARIILLATVDSWEAITGNDAPPLPEINEEKFRALQRKTEGRPLYLQMAALHVCETRSATELFHLNRSDLLKFAVQRERDYAGKICKNGPSQELVERVLALLVFAGKVSAQDPELLTVIDEEAKARGHTQTAPADVLKVVRQLTTEYQSEEQEVFLEPIQPDLIGSAFASTVLQEQGGITNILNRSIRLGGAGAWDNLLRSARDLYGIGNFELENWLPPLLKGMGEEELWGIVTFLPEQTVALGSFAVELYENLLEKTSNEEQKAIVIGNLGNKYGAMGQSEEALQCAEKATEYYETLLSLNHDEYAPKLARSLNNLGKFYSDLGERENAIACAERAKEIFEGFYDRTNTYELERAVSLNNLGSFYGEGGRLEKAINCIEQAVEIYKRLLSQNLDEVDQCLAMSLTNLGAFYGDLNQRKKALECLDEAYEIYYQLWSRQPDAFEPMLANNYNNLGTINNKFDLNDEAITFGLKAKIIFQRLSLLNPVAFEPDYARSLHNLGKYYREEDKFDDALKYSEEARKIFFRLSKENQAVFEPKLAVNLNLLGVICAELNNKEKALQYTEQAVKILKDFSLQNPEEYEPNLALSLHNLGIRYNELNRLEDALKSAESSREIYQRLIQKNKIFEPYLAVCLLSLVKRYKSFDRHNDALKCAEEAKLIYEDLLLQDPESNYESDYAESLNELGNISNQLGSFEEALLFVKKAIEIRKGLTLHDPNLYDPDLALSMGALGAIYRDNGQPDKARDQFASGIQTLTRIFFISPIAFSALIKNLCSDYLEACDALGEEPDAELLGPIVQKLQELEGE